MHTLNNITFMILHCALTDSREGGVMCVCGGLYDCTSPGWMVILYVLHILFFPSIDFLILSFINFYFTLYVLLLYAPLQEKAKISVYPNIIWMIKESYEDYCIKGLLKGPMELVWKEKKSLLFTLPSNPAPIPTPTHHVIQY